MNISAREKIVLKAVKARVKEVNESSMRGKRRKDEREGREGIMEASIAR